MIELIDLPPEILSMIWIYVKFQDYRKLLLTCRYFSEIGRNIELRKKSEYFQIIEIINTNDMTITAQKESCQSFKYEYRYNQDRNKYKVITTNLQGILHGSYLKVENFTEKYRTYEHGCIHGLQMKYFQGKLSEKCSYIDGIKDGIHEYYHLNGRLESSFNFVNDKRQGTSHTWYPSGNIRTIGYWNRNKCHGLSLIWFENGTLQVALFYWNDRIIELNQ